MQTSVTQVYLQVTKRVQPKLAKGNDCLSVSYTHKVRITERVPQHPKNRRKDSSDKARHRLKNVAEKATSEQRKSRLMRPVCRGFCFFCPAKEGNRNYCLKWLQPKIKGKTDFWTPPSSKKVFDRPLKFGTPSERELVPTIALKFASTKEWGFIQV